MSTCVVGDGRAKVASLAPDIRSTITTPASLPRTVPSRTPITYFDSPLGNRGCNCGCGKSIGRGDFLPGHDQRAVHERIARVGTVMDFIAWFDQTWKPDEDQQDDAA